MYNPLQVEQAHALENEIRLREQHRSPWDRPDAGRGRATHRHHWWSRARKA